jgi:hypothetical protein
MKTKLSLATCLLLACGSTHSAETSNGTGGGQAGDANLVRAL